MDGPDGSANVLQLNHHRPAEACAAMQVFDEFLKALAARDVPRAMQWVADDFHVVENDREINANDFCCRLEAFVESLRGWEIDISLPVAPEMLPLSSGIVMFTEIQIDMRDPATNRKDNLVAGRFVLLQKQADASWKISGMGRPEN